MKASNEFAYYDGPIKHAIFLDIDGVLNRHYERSSDPHVIKTSHGKLLNTTLIDALNTLTDETGAVIVISSSWRRRDLCVASILRESGVTGEIAGETPKLGEHYIRGNEILAWIKENTSRLGVSTYSDFKQYLILDDSDDMLLWQANHLVLLDGESGFTATMAYRSSRKLRSMQNLTDIKMRQRVIS